MSKLPFLTKAFFARVANPVARAALWTGLTPDVATIIGTIATVASALTPARCLSKLSALPPST